VLVLHSFGRDFAPYDTIASVFRTELARRAAEPITFVEANLDSGRLTNEREQRAFIEYLGARFADGPPDVAVTIGPPAARFYLQHRADLFPRVPVVFGSMDERFARQISLQPADAVVAGKVDLPGLVQNILQLLPKTETIAVIVGASELERFWLGELKRELAPFEGRVKFEWLNTFSLDEMRERVANLPPHSAILYGLLIVDSAGVPHERQDGLEKLREAANAPIFGLYESEIGKGVVGGPYSSQRMRGEHIANAALVALGETTISQSRIDVTGLERPVYDSRELERWSIDHSRLPAGSEVRFRTPSLWEQHRMSVIATTAAIFVQAALIVGLLIQRRRRHRAEKDARGLAGRLVTAHEDERRRLARELHDDVTQRLAALAIDAGNMHHDPSSVASGEPLLAIRERLVGLSEDVHSLSYRLHPAVIDDLGLVSALRVECKRVAQHDPIRVNFDCHDVPTSVPSNVAICLFRVAQEALRNVVRHAQARNVEVSLKTKEGGITLAVRDDGKGLTDPGVDARASLGLVSMRERVRLVGGNLHIQSRPNEGTSVIAWVPMPGAA
jgi:signal transduction histidine kinase